MAWHSQNRNLRCESIRHPQCLLASRSNPAFVAFLLPSGRPFFAALRGSARLAPRPWRPRFPDRGDRPAKAPHSRHSSFLRACATWSCRESARSTVSAQAAMRARFARVSHSSVAQIYRSNPRAPDWLCGFPEQSAGRRCGNRFCRIVCLR